MNEKLLTIKELRDYLNNIPSQFDDNPIMSFHNEYDDEGNETDGTGIFITHAVLQDNCPSENETPITELWLMN